MAGSFLKNPKNQQAESWSKQAEQQSKTEKKKKKRIQNKKEPKSLNPGNQSEHNTQSLHRKDGKTLQRECVCVRMKSLNRQGDWEKTLQDGAGRGCGWSKMLRTYHIWRL